jgi:hypothetical protein
MNFAIGGGNVKPGLASLGTVPLITAAFINSKLDSDMISFV